MHQALDEAIISLLFLALFVVYGTLRHWTGLVYSYFRVSPLQFIEEF